MLEGPKKINAQAVKVASSAPENLKNSKASKISIGAPLEVSTKALKNHKFTHLKAESDEKLSELFNNTPIVVFKKATKAAI